MNHIEGKTNTTNPLETKENFEGRITKNLSKVNKKTAKDIMGNLMDGALEAILQVLKEKEPRIKKLVEIPEFKNLVLKEAHFERGNIHLTFDVHDFTGNSRQLLLKNGYNKNDIAYGRKGNIRIFLYGASMILNIDTK